MCAVWGDQNEELLHSYPDNKVVHVIRVLVVDDHEILRLGLKMVLDLVPDMIFVGEARTGQEALLLDEELTPDVILMDLMMPDMNGIEAIRLIKAQRPAARIMVLTAFDREELVFAAIKAGATGYHLKDSSPHTLLQAIRDVYRGESSLHPVIAHKLLHEFSVPDISSDALETLTQRELQVLDLVARGQENQEIAAQLVISEATVRKHISNILDKLQLASRTQAALYALHVGLGSPEKLINNT